MFRDNEEKNIFILFFLFFGIFTKTAPMVNDSSRLATIESVVEGGTFIIDNSTFNSTIDKALINGHFYSDKAPGSAFLGVPIYFLLRIFGLSFSANLDICYFLLTILSSGLASSLLAVIFFRMTSRYIEDKRRRYLLTGSILSTTLLPFSVVLNSHIMSAFLVFASFYFLFHEKNLLYSGILSGLSVIFEPQSAIAGLAFTAYTIWDSRNKSHEFFLPFFALSCIIPLYNYSVTSDPLSFPYEYVGAWEGSPWASQGSIIPIRYEKRDPGRIYDILFDLDAGLLIYSPILILSFLSLRKFKNKEIALSFTILSGFIIFFWRAARIYLGECNYGSRFFVPIIPLLLFTLVYAKDVKDKLIWLLTGIGLTINLIGAKIDPWMCPAGLPNMVTASLFFLSHPSYWVSWLNLLFVLGFIIYVFRDRIPQKALIHRFSKG